MVNNGYIIYIMMVNDGYIEIPSGNLLQFAIENGY